MTAVKLKSSPKWSITGGAHKQWQSGNRQFNFLELHCLLFIRPILIYLGPWDWVLGSSRFSCLNDIFLVSTALFFLCQFLMDSAPTTWPEVLRCACGLLSVFRLVNSYKYILSNYSSRKSQHLHGDWSAGNENQQLNNVSLQSNLVKNSGSLFLRKPTSVCKWEACHCFTEQEIKTTPLPPSQIISSLCCYKQGLRFLVPLGFLSYKEHVKRVWGSYYTRRNCY